MTPRLSAASDRTLSPLSIFFGAGLLAAVLLCPAAAAQSDPPADEAPGQATRDAREKAGDDASMVDIGGFRLHAQVLGAENQGPTLVFEAGGGQTLDSWRDLPQRAAQTWPVIVYERAGLGRSEPGPEPRTAKRVAQELRRLLATIEKSHDPSGHDPSGRDLSGPYVLVMHSLGGLYGRIFAELYPDQVAGFVFIDPTTEGMHRSLWTEDGRAQYEAQLADFTAGERAEALQLRHQHEELEAAGPPLNRPALVLTARPEISIPEEAREQMEAHGLTEERLRELQELKTRLHAELAAELPRGRQVEVPGASHFVHWQAPEKVLEAIREVVALVSTP